MSLGTVGGWRARSTKHAQEEAALLQKLIDSPAKIEGERDRVMTGMASATLATLALAFLALIFLRDRFLMLESLQRRFTSSVSTQVVRLALTDERMFER